MSVRLRVLRKQQLTLCYRDIGNRPDAISIRGERRVNRGTRSGNQRRCRAVSGETGLHGISGHDDLTDSLVLGLTVRRLGLRLFGVLRDSVADARRSRAAASA